MHVGIFTTRTTDRLSYLLDFIFGEFFQARYSLFQNPKEFKEFDGPKVCYHRERISKAVWIKPHPLLFENDIKPLHLKLSKWNGNFGIFQTSDEQDAFGIDVFAQSFYFLSRYEEYLNTEKDELGRFPGTLSFLYKNNLHEFPFVDDWLIILKQQLQSFFPATTLELKTQAPLLPTIDIDYPWEFRYLPRKWQFAKLIKALSAGNISNFKKWISLLASNGLDSFDQYFRINELLIDLPQSLVFFLMSNQGYPDQNRHLQQAEFSHLIQKISRNFQIGVHPSVSSTSDKNRLAKEIQLLENMTKEKIIHSRQHFVLLQLPDTYRQLLENGIQHDYSMGFHDICGFRAGTSRNFNWYDLNSEQSTALKIHPFFWMDVTLKNYLQLSPAKAVEKVLHLKTKVKKIGGTYSFIWHNSSWDKQSGWEDWEQVLQAALNPIMPD